MSNPVPAHFHIISVRHACDPAAMEAARRAGVEPCTHVLSESSSMTSLERNVDRKFQELTREFITRSRELYPFRRISIRLTDKKRRHQR